MSKMILVIDDDEHIVKVLASRLLANNYKVETAANGEEGLERVRNTVPDLIILDILMPKMDGYSFLLQMKKENLLPGPPVIVLTAKDNMQDLFEIEGISEYVVKPFKSEELLQRIEKVLGVSNGKSE